MITALTVAQQGVYEATLNKHGYVYAQQLLSDWLQPRVVGKMLPALADSSHDEATDLLELYKENLGAAYPTLHLLARWSIENATESEPAPHLMTTYWTLEEALGLSERTLRRHLVEDGHAWSETVRHLLDIKHNYGEMLAGKDDWGQNKTRSVCVATVIRFFPKGRLSNNARVKKWGYRDLLLESDEGRTRNTRPNLEKHRYQRQNPLMSAYSSIKEQSVEQNWLMIKLGQSVSTRVENKNLGNLYADIPNNYVLHALREDLALAVSQAQEKGMNVKRARSKWVNVAAQLLAQRHSDAKPLLRHHHAKHVTHFDGFTNLWRRMLWTAIKAELYGGTTQGWKHVQRMITFCGDAKAEGKEKPSAWAWSIVKQDLEALYRDYGSGAAGECIITSN